MKTKAKSGKFKIWLFTILAAMIILPTVGILIMRLEGESPTFVFTLDSPNVGLSKDFSGSVSDAKSGIRHLWVAVLKDGKEIVLLNKSFPAPEGILGKGQTHADFTVQLEPQKVGLKDGKAVLRMKARDYSWRNGLKGNQTYLEKEIFIDTRAPEIEVVSRQHNVSQGGSGLIIYRVSEPGTESGVVIGDNFFPGYSGQFKDPKLYLAFFALKHDQDPETEIYLKAVDPSGNTAKVGFPLYLKRKNFRTDTINISDRFLRWKMPEFNTPGTALGNDGLVDKFIYVNRTLRKENGKTLMDLSRNTDHKMHWEGEFIRLPGAARMASFADKRTYKYQGKTIDHQYHLGIDLASVAHSKVPAANGGKVALAHTVGIYGKTVVLDHGYGLFSVYGHLSRIDVQQGQLVQKGDTLGLTGTTGMAGGDHLHFGMFIQKVFVNPIEWWDPAWIQHNITSKIEQAAAG